MTRMLAAVLFVLCCAGAPQRTAVAQPAATTPAAATTPVAAQQALEVLRDPVRRAELISVLEALARAAAVPEGAAKPADPAPLEIDSMGAELLLGASEWLSRLFDQTIETSRRVASLPLIWHWVADLAGDAARQERLFGVAWRLVAVFAAGLTVEWLIVRLLRPVRGRVAGAAPVLPPVAHARRDAGAAGGARLQAAELALRQSARLWRRVRQVQRQLRLLPYALAGFVLDLVPVLGVLATGSVLIGLGLGDQLLARLLILAAVNAYVVFRVVTAAVAMLVAPVETRLRLLAVSDATAARVRLWAWRFAAVAIFGYALLEAGLLFGLHRAAHGALLKLVGLVLHLFAVTIILRGRARVAAWIALPGVAVADSAGSDGVATGEQGTGGRLRARLAAVWHVIAIAYVVALWLVLALEVPDGFVRLLRVFAGTAAVLLAARLALIVTLGGVQRLIIASASRLGGRLGPYETVLRAAVRVSLGGLALLGVLEAWGIPALSWFAAGRLGGRLLGVLGAVALTLALAALVWEAANTAIDRYLAALDAGAQAARAVRLRTLLPMLRTTLLVAICVVAGLIALSEIGLNIAPLLAGAGVFGLALGFGSQRLVQDVITGLFLLLENTMQVGDVVTLGGMTGTVENLSIRTIRLRALDGSMHIVPFSSVTTVTNMTRDFGYAVVDVSVGLNEDTDKVGTLLREVGAEMRGEPRWADAISADLEVMGVDRFIDNAVVLRTRIRTTPGQRWAVGRELNRRIKQRFDAHAVESPMTSHRALQNAVLDESSG